MNQNGFLSKDMAIFFGFIAVFLFIVIIKITFFEKKREPLEIIENDTLTNDANKESDKTNQEKAKGIMRNVYKAVEKKLEDDVKEANRAFSNSIKSFKE